MSTKRIENVTNIEFEKLFEDELRKKGKNHKKIQYLNNVLKSVNEPSNEEKLNKFLNDHVDVIKGMEDDGLPFTYLNVKHISKQSLKKLEELKESEQLKL